MKEYLEQRIPPGETPMVRLRHAVRGDLIFASTHAPEGTYKAYMNQYGAVSIIATDGKLLGLYPSEFDWVSGRPSHWGHGDEYTVYRITPYEGDWTLDAARAALAPVDYKASMEEWIKDGGTTD